MSTEKIKDMEKKLCDMVKDTLTRLQKAKLASNLSYEQIAVLIGEPGQGRNISNLLRGLTKNPNIEQMDRIAEVLKVKIDTNGGMGIDAAVREVLMSDELVGLPPSVQVQIIRKGIQAFNQFLK